MKTQTTIRIEETTYRQAKEILKKLGLSYSQVINALNDIIVSNKGLPFDLEIANNETKKAFKELETKKGKTFKNLDDLFNDLDS